LQSLHSFYSKSEVRLFVSCWSDGAYSAVPGYAVFPVYIFRKLYCSLQQAYLGGTINHFFAAKKKYDPIELFANTFSEKYGM